MTSKEMKSSGALYVKYKFPLTEALTLKGHFDIDKDQQIELAINDKIAFKMIDKKEF